MFTAEDWAAAALEQRAQRKRWYEPVGDTLIIRAVPAERTDAGLYIPGKGATAEAKMKAIVVAAGPGRMRDDGSLVPMRAKIGDHVIIWKEAPTPGSISFTGEELFICHDADVAAIVIDVPAEEVPS